MQGKSRSYSKKPEEQSNPLERMTTDSRTVQKTVQALKDKESVGGKQYPRNQAAMHGPPRKVSLVDGRIAQIGIKEERHNPRPKDNNRITAHRQDIQKT